MDLQNTDMSKSKFESCNLKNSQISHCDLSNVQIQNCNLTGFRINGILVEDLFKYYTGKHDY